MAASQQNADKGAATLDAQREKRAIQVFLKSVQTQIVSAADAMPAVKYGFVPTDGEFKGVHTFGQQVKHLAATNNILAAAALGEQTPAGAGDEMGPETVRTRWDRSRVTRGLLLIHTECAQTLTLRRTLNFRRPGTRGQDEIVQFEKGR
jgi:hypothetical protein